ncbi:hypothetical protein [Polynucleobacter sp. UK-Kesae-W10]|uniref:hypothetical protein n=1 Tax=Polynucleobacter sp. UK-Kesae-W10 TaxID=1819738 RepID=UPI001C0D1AD4|nr:hypothetical protein [Polynucleobacter sp. UK-Kesae-W10]MBU3577537.1 hypothetical protein [Polynucleobacter sp. UK-Kesae-W10]
MKNLSYTDIPYTEGRILTPTFPPDILPVRSGVYFTRELDLDTGERLGEMFMFSYFDATDRIWGCAAGNRESAWKEPGYEFASQNKEWIGLAEEPKL